MARQVRRPTTAPQVPSPSPSPVQRLTTVPQVHLQSRAEVKSAAQSSITLVHRLPSRQPPQSVLQKVRKSARAERTRKSCLSPAASWLLLGNFPLLFSIFQPLLNFWEIKLQPNFWESRLGFLRMVPPQKVLLEISVSTSKTMQKQQM